MASDKRNKRVVHVEITTGSVVLFLAAIGVAFAIAEVMISARRILSWVVASAVAAALIELAVQFLDRWMKRAVAIVLVLLAIAATAGLLAFGVFRDLDHEVQRLQDAAPVAAREIEESKRFGGVATEIDLDRRVATAVERLSAPSSGLAGEAVSSVGTYTVCAILTILFLSWGPRVTAAAVNQLDPRTPRRVHVTARDAFRRSRRYVMLALSQAVVVGLIGFAVCKWAEMPAPAPLALALAAMTLIPNIGILVGSLPILLLSGGLGTPGRTTVLAVLFLVLQVASSMLVQRRIVRASKLYVGPAIVVIAYLAGFELYGIGGAMYAAAFAVLAVAAIDANAELTDDELSESERALTTP